MSVNIYDASTGTLTRVDKNPVFTGATASAAGAKGVVPAPAAGDEDKYLKGDGSWAEAAADDNYVGTKAAWDQMQASEKEKYKTADFTDDMDGYLIDDVPTSGSQNVVKSGGVYSQINAVTQALTTTQSSIAPIEDGTNYSQTYYKGNEFYRNGVLYKVTASSVNTSTAINTGSGGNATAADSITKQIKHKWSAETEVTVTNGSLFFCESNDGLLRKCRFSVTQNGDANTFNGVVPSDYRPNNNLAFVAYNANGNLRGGIIYANGNFYIDTSTSTGFTGQVIY